jgi:Zn finger protein HypA/HybF involved in hydrogenase expression
MLRHSNRLERILNTKTGKCLCCDATVWEASLSLRGWCPACELEFKRVTTQAEARRILQLEMDLDSQAHRDQE